MQHVRLAVFLLGSVPVMSSAQTPPAGSFADDASFIASHVDTITLKDGDARVAVVPAYQGRVMTSSFAGDAGPSLGWINRKVIEGGILAPEQARGKLEAHIHIFGGEERYWLGPEGGQFAIYFQPGSKFDFEVWKTPAPIDTDAWSVNETTATSASFEHAFELQNWSGTRFLCKADRKVSLVPRTDVAAQLGVDLPDTVRLVAYETDNRLTNRGTNTWTKTGGMLSIWMLGMYKHSEATTVVIPFVKGDAAELGPVVNDEYFGKVPAERLVVRDGVMFFSGDGKLRAKIGLPPGRSKGIAGSYASDSGVLTLLTYNQPEGAKEYVNSMWALQKDPFSGDAVNAYNDGSPAPGAPPLGPFYELESSSPAAALAPGRTVRHVQRTIHLTGPEPVLDAIARKWLGAGLNEIKTALPK